MNIESLIKHRWFTSILILCFWIFAGTLITVQSYFYRLNVGQHITWWGLYPLEVFYFILWAFFTPLVLWLSHRFKFEKQNRISRFGIHLILAILLAVAHRSIYDFISLNIRATAENPFSWQNFSNSVLGFSDYGVFIYFIVLFVSLAIEYSRILYEEQVKGVRLREELAVAQLQSLKMQLHPHFLFNTLNTISVLIKEEPDVAEQMICLLSDLLRKSLQYTSTNEILLRDEINFLEMYLQIEQKRFGDRLSITLDIKEETMDTYVPTLILQPLVENAINHGIAKRRGAGRLGISSKRSDGMIALTVFDDGHGIAAGSSGDHSEGIGLANTKSRLHTLYGDSSTLNLSRAESGGTIAEIRMPFHPQPL
jgi:two-component system, LytTR family, sensor kinase